MSELRAVGLGFQYPSGPPVVRSVDLQLRIGELAVVLARNSSGKTTLLKLLAGILRPCEGRVIVTESESLDLRICTGLVFQNPDHQMIAPTVEEELALGLEFRNVNRDEITHRVESLLLQFHLDDLRHASPESLSGGQKQRVALAAILAMEPPFLLLDEPDSYLDAPSRRDFLSAIEGIRADRGILWAVPSPYAMPAADRWFLLDKCRLSEVTYREAVELADDYAA